MVNMFLTGFDATTLNTLWVDKNLRQHGLIQAYSRTNRILNSVKTYGNIVVLPRPGAGDQRRHRALRQQGRPRASCSSSRTATITASTRNRSPRCWQLYPLADAPITGEAARRRSSRCSAQILRLRNILTSFDEFAGHEIITRATFQDYRSIYLDLYAEFRTDQPSREGVDQRRRRLRDRAHQAGRDQRRLHPHARPEVA